MGLRYSFSLVEVNNTDQELLTIPFMFLAQGKERIVTLKFTYNQNKLTVTNAPGSGGTSIVVAETVTNVQPGMTYKITKSAVTESIGVLAVNEQTRTLTVTRGNTPVNLQADDELLELQPDIHGFGFRSEAMDDSVSGGFDIVDNEWLSIKVTGEHVSFQPLGEYIIDTMSPGEEKEFQLRLYIPIHVGAECSGAPFDIGEGMMFCRIQPFGTLEWFIEGGYSEAFYSEVGYSENSGLGELTTYLTGYLVQAYIISPEQSAFMTNAGITVIT